MRIAFIDFIEWDYSPETPYQGPLGGVQSAVCYLSECLAQNGHKVFLINNHPEMEVVRGVFVIPLNVDHRILRNTFGKFDEDVLIVIGSSSAGPQSSSGACPPFVGSAAVVVPPRRTHRRAPHPDL